MASNLSARRQLRMQGEVSAEVLAVLAGHRTAADHPLTIELRDEKGRKVSIVRGHVAYLDVAEHAMAIECDAVLIVHAVEEYFEQPSTSPMAKVARVRARGKK